MPSAAVHDLGLDLVFLLCLFVLLLAGFKSKYFFLYLFHHTVNSAAPHSTVIVDKKYFCLFLVQCFSAVDLLRELFDFIVYLTDDQAFLSVNGANKGKCNCLCTSNGRFCVIEHFSFSLTMSITFAVFVISVPYLHLIFVSVGNSKGYPKGRPLK